MLKEQAFAESYWILVSAQVTLWDREQSQQVVAAQIFSRNRGGKERKSGVDLLVVEQFSLLLNEECGKKLNGYDQSIIRCGN